MAITQLDPSQKHTLKAVVSSNSANISVVHGPPGTGKSQLLVNLLFELASANKSVLFVSQNTEALEVIERKIKDVERDMLLDDDSLTFRDFILKLYAKEHRTLKYISRQYSRLQSRSIPSYDKAALDSKVEQLNYPLSYTKLEKYENEHLTNPVIGIDELLAYYLKHVKTQMVGSNVRDLALIDVRKVMSHLDTFSDEYHSFITHNHPQNALRFVSKTNPLVTLGKIREQGSKIELAYDALDESIKNLKTIQKTDVREFIEALGLYTDLSQHIYLNKLQSSTLSPASLVEALNSAVEQAQEVIPEADRLFALDDRRDILFPHLEFRNYLVNDRIEAFSTDTDAIVTAVDHLTNGIPGVDDSTILDVIDDAMRHIDLDIQPLVDVVPSLAELNAMQISEVITLLNQWSDSNAFMKTLKKKPEGIDRYISNINKSQLENLIENVNVLGTLVGILSDTPITVGLYNKIFMHAKKRTVAFNQLKGLDLDTATEMINRALMVNLLLQKYSTKKDITISEIKKLFRLLINDTDYYRRVISGNKQLHHKEASEIIELINKNIISNKAIVHLEKIYQDYAEYIVESDSSDFQAKAHLLVNSGDNLVNSLVKVVSSIDVPLQFKADSSGIKHLRAVIDESATTDIFSDQYFWLEQGSSLKSWYDNIGTLMTYNSTKELDSFVQQHAFLAELRNLLGKNAGWVDDRISDESVDYERFRERIVNDLVRGTVESMSYADRKGIESDFFDNYRAQLSAKRKSYYLAGLKNIFTYYSLEGAKRISNTNNWNPGASTMDKIRANTDLIKDTYPIVLATPKEVAKYISPTAGMFDYVLFDEASQLLPGQAIPAIFRAKKAVIVGDPHQMPPSLTTRFGSVEIEPDEDGFEDAGDSILDLAISLQNTTEQHHLKVHYRSESNKLFEPSRVAIYSKDGIQPIIEARTYERTPISIEDNLGDDDTKNFELIVSRITSRLSHESDATFCILFTRADVLSAFKDYITENEAAFKHIADLYEENRILISTVTNCQGIEGDYSIMYLNSYTAPGRMWFFNEKGGAYKRLNVAITRQRKNLDILMANPKSLWLSACERVISSHNSQPNTRKSADLLQSLLRNAGEAVDEAYLDRTLSKNELNIDSPLTEQLYLMLQDHYRNDLGKKLKIYCEVGWHLQIPNDDNILENKRNVGFRIDIGIYSPEAQAFVLGIEMDGAAYHSGYDKEHSDYLREQVLRSKGWDIYRLWSTNWLNDTKGEFTKLIQHIDYQLNNAQKVDQYSVANLKSARPDNFTDSEEDGAANLMTQVRIVDTDELV